MVCSYISNLDYQTCKKYLDEYLRGLKEIFGEDLLGVALYGSIARGTADFSSDIDLLIVCKKVTTEQTMKMINFQRSLENTEPFKELIKIGVNPYHLYHIVLPVYISIEEFDSNPWLLLDIQDHGIILYDPHEILERKFEYIRKRLKELGSKKILLPNGKWYWDLKPDWKPGEVIKL